jgi:acyl carrier protein
MSDQISATVYAALGRQLKLDVERVRAMAGESLDGLGLDSHGLMRVLLDIERELKLATSLELPDEALENPGTLVAGVVQAVNGG